MPSRSALLLGSNFASAVVIASWDFTSDVNPLADTSVNDYDLTNNGEVTFSTSTGATFSSSNNLYYDYGNPNSGSTVLDPDSSFVIGAYGENGGNE